jgi:protocatechuate 3,4-dioxygenase beta subunit
MSPQSPRSPYLDRRRVLALIAGGVGTAVIAACSSDDTATSNTSVTGAPDTPSVESPGATTASDTSVAEETSVVECSTIPEETAGPFPGDGSNGPDVLSIDGVERSDIRTSIGDASGTAEGTQLTIELTIVDSSASCAPLAGAAVYLWHADSVGRYSMYSSGVTDENYLRGVQVADGNGKLSFVSVFPGCYDGRWPHIHFEVYASRADVGSGRPLTTSQLAFPEDACVMAYAAAGYEQSVSNLDRVSLESDMVFRDGVDDQLAAMSGDSTSGFTAALTVVV